MNKMPIEEIKLVSNIGSHALKHINTFTDFYHIFGYRDDKKIPHFGANLWNHHDERWQMFRYQLDIYPVDDALITGVVEKKMGEGGSWLLSSQKDLLEIIIESDCLARIHFSKIKGSLIRAPFSYTSRYPDVKACMDMLSTNYMIYGSGTGYCIDDPISRYIFSRPRRPDRRLPDEPPLVNSQILMNPNPGASIDRIALTDNRLDFMAEFHSRMGGMLNLSIPDIVGHVDYAILMSS